MYLACVVLTVFLSTTSATINQVNEFTDYYLPSLSIDSRNKFFSCDEPTIKVKMNYNKISMTCSNFEFNPHLRFVGEQHFEKLYYVETREEYDTCNATNGFPILVCNGTKSPDRTCSKYEKTCTVSRLESIEYMPKERTAYQYRVGGTFYFIATSYRTLSNIDNKIGGSCLKSEVPGEYRIRFKIYVCTNEEADRGECDPQRSLASYYKQCIDKCTPWKQNPSEITKSINHKCYIREHRNCTNIDTEVATPQQRDIEIPCPAHKCDEWKDINAITKTNTTVCTKREKRYCTNPFDNTVYDEMRELPTDCPQKQLCTNWEFDNVNMILRNFTCYYARKRVCKEFGTPYEESDEVIITCPILQEPKVAESIGDQTKDVSKQNMYIAIGASIGAFFIGLAIGVTCWHYHRRNATGAIHGQVMLAENGYTNKGFAPRSPEHHVYEFARDVFPPNPRLERVVSTGMPIYHTALGRSLSLQYADESVFSGPDAVHYHTERPRRPGKVKVDRHVSATSRTNLMRHFSDVSDAKRSRITSQTSSIASTISKPTSREASINSGDYRPEIEIKHKQVDVIHEV